MWMQKTMAHLFVEEGRAGWSIAKAMGLAPNRLPFDRAAEGGTWKFFEGKKKLNNSIDQNMFQVIDHCHHDWIWISDIQSQTSRLIHVNTFITSSQNLGRLPLVCSWTSHDINESEGKVLFFFCIEVLGRRTTSRPSWPWWRMKRWLQRMRWGGLRRQRDDALWAIITFVLLQSFFPKTKTEMKPFRVGSADWRRTARNTYSRTGMEVSYWVEILEGTVDCGITWKIWRNPGY